MPHPVYRKLVETFHDVSECKTDTYFCRCLIQALAQQITANLTIDINMALLVAIAVRFRLTTINRDKIRH